jgi:hypothetical protein
MRLKSTDELYQGKNTGNRSFENPPVHSIKREDYIAKTIHPVTVMNSDTLST